MCIRDSLIDGSLVIARGALARELSGNGLLHFVVRLKGLVAGQCALALGIAQTRALDGHLAPGEDHITCLVAVPPRALFSPRACLAIELLLHHSLDDFKAHFRTERFAVSYTHLR